MSENPLSQMLARLDLLDERLGYRLRGRGGSLSTPTVDQLDKRCSEVAEYVVEMKEILRELLRTLDGRP
jgi:hypothetical protein